MIRNTFLFLPGMTERKEQNLWGQGILDWNTFLRTECIIGIAPRKKQLYDALLSEAKQHLFEEDSEYFYRMIPKRYQWRLYDYFNDRICFLDIETSDNNRDITVIGFFDGINTGQLVRGINLNRESFINTIKNYSLLVTFNGSSFDIPKLEKYFSIKLNIPHIDLRHVLKKLKHEGGLKKIELEFGIQRAPKLALMNGYHAVDAWKMWTVTGEKTYLDLLLQYNEEDVVNLKQLADQSIVQLWEKVRTVRGTIATSVPSNEQH